MRFFMQIICTVFFLIGHKHLSTENEYHAAIKQHIFFELSANSLNFRTVNKRINQSQSLSEADVTSPQQQQHPQQWPTNTVSVSLSPECYLTDET